MLTWLRLINESLPALVKQRYGTELRNKTLASLKPEISMALDSLLEEINSTNESRILRTSYKSIPSVPTRKEKFKPKRNPNKQCPLCQQAGRQKTDHYLSRCKYLPDHDKEYLSKVRRTVADSESDSDSELDDQSTNSSVPIVTRRVGTNQSPNIKMFYQHHPVTVTLDTGAETSMIKASFAKFLSIPINKSTQQAMQADGVTPLDIIGEVHVTLSRGNYDYKLDALVVSDLDVDILGGVTFMATNDISTRPAKQQVVIHDREIVQYGPLSRSDPTHRVRRTQVSFVMRTSTVSQVTWPGSYVELDVPNDIDPEGCFAVEPKSDHQSWLTPQIVEAVSGKVRVMNTTSEPVTIRKNEHVCDARHTVNICDNPSPKEPKYTTNVKKNNADSTYVTNTIQLDPDGILSHECKQSFQSVLQKFENVFSPDIGGYNGAAGPLKAKVNMGPVLPPQRKGRVPQYSRDKLVELQEKFDELESQGVFARPEDIDISVEYLNPSFLVKKPQGGYRLVTAFADVGRYSKPQPSLMADVESVLRTIGQWNYLIVSDLKSAFYQIPLSDESLKYCGVATPFKGVRVYTRCAMGMPGSETALEELMCRVLGDLLQEGVVCKLADDLYCGGDTPEKLLENWQRVLSALEKCNIKLAPSKTIICPRTTVILGWIWSEGRLSASPHRVSTLASCKPPDTVHGLRSFIGAYKVLGKVLSQCSSYLAPLDEIVAGQQSCDKIQWDEQRLSHFEKAKRALTNHKSIVIPRSDEQLWIVTDGSVSKHGIGATLYVTRKDKVKLAGFFSAKLKKHQVTWLPCEIEALSIGASVKHFSPYIIQSSKTTCVLTDSKPCVQSVQKLYRGEFSSSPRVTSFLSNVSRYQISVKHLAGSANVPSDFASRNAPDCEVNSCQICTFITTMEESVVRSVKVDDILNDTAHLPFTTRSSWREIQNECPDLRRVHSHLKQGTRPSKKLTKIKDVKRYLQSATISKDGLLIVKQSEPFSTDREQIIVPRTVLNGLLTALHVKLDHPTKHQLDLAVRRHFFALDLTKAVELVTESCHTCASIKKLPKTLVKQSSEDPPESVGMTFAADVMKRSRQCLLVVRETTTSFTKTKIIDNEQKVTIRDALLCLVNEMHPLHGPQAVIRVDPAPAFIGLRDDDYLKQCNIVLDIGRVKNSNKNPVAEKAILELEDELIRIQPGGEPINEVQLSIATNRLNCRLRRNGISSREMWTQRDQYTHNQLPINDREVIMSQFSDRMKNHSYSEKSKFPKNSEKKCDSICVGDIVYITSDKKKHVSRQRYLVVSVEGEWCYLKKFVGNQLRSSSYKVKKSECFRVQSDLRDVWYDTVSPDSESDLDSDVRPSFVKAPDIAPDNISIPPTLSHPHDEDMEEVPALLLAEPITDQQDIDTPDPEPEPSVISRPRRSRKQPKYLEDYVLS